MIIFPNQSALFFIKIYHWSLLLSTNPSDVVMNDMQCERLQMLCDRNRSRNCIQISTSETLGKRYGSLIKFSFMLCAWMLVFRESSFTAASYFLSFQSMKLTTQRRIYSWSNWSSTDLSSCIRRLSIASGNPGNWSSSLPLRYLVTMAGIPGLISVFVYFLVIGGKLV